MKKYFLFIAALPALVTSVALAQVWGGPATMDPHKDWKRLDSDHFEIIYEVNQKNLALKVAAEAERAHLLLKPLLKTEMADKTVVVIADITDNSNGMATGLPQNTITIYPVLPTVDASIGEYYDWIRELITHEYTHIQQFEPTSGLMGVAHFIFGNIWKPNQYLPRWYAEGLAVEMESRLTPLGRGRSHYYSALDRSFFETGSWDQINIGEINSTSTPTWPRGQRPYYLGFDLIHHLSQTKNELGIPGPEIYGYLNNSTGGRFPYFINGPAEDAFGKSYSELFSDMQKSKKFDVQQSWDQLKASGARNGVPLHQSGYFNFGAQVSPDGLKLAAIISDFNKEAAIKMWTRKSTAASFNTVTEEPKTLTTGKDIHQISWKADSKTLLFDKSQTIAHYYSFSDLFEVRVDADEDEDAKELTHGRRAREGTYLSDGSIAFIQISATQTSLAIMDGKGIRTVYRAPEGERLSTPRPGPRGEILFSHRDTKGREWIETYKNGQVQALTHPSKIGEMHVTPASFADGFLYSGSQTGVMNIYRNEGGKSYPVTNIKTLATNATYDPWAKEIIFSRLTDQGFQLETHPLKSAYGLDLPVIKPTHEFPPAEEKPALAARVSEEKDYWGLAYLLPHYWYPFITMVPGGFVFDAITGSSDPLGHHNYNLDVGYDTRSQQFRQSVDYENTLLGFPVDLLFINNYEYLAGLSATEQIIFGQIATSHPLQSDENKWSISPQFSYKMTNYPGSPGIVSGVLVTEIGPGISLGFSNVSRPRDYQISPEKGHSFTIGYNYFLPGVGNTSYQNINGVMQKYFSGSPLPDRHVIKLKTAAWISPPQNTIFSGMQQAGGEYGGLFFNQTFVVRGYPYGEFIGSTLITANAEYRFPLGYTYGGVGTFPLFTKAWYGALVFDAITLDGGYYNSSGSSIRLLSTKLGSFFFGTGAELKGDFQILYGWDLTFKAGIYYGLTDFAFGGINYFVGMGSPL